MSEDINKIYSNFTIDRKQAQTLAYSILDFIEEYCETHLEEFQEFLKAEETKERGRKKFK